MVPVLVVTGPVGSGTSTILHEADRIVVAAGSHHATVELEDIARFWPAESKDNCRRVFRNLASVWRTFSEGGANRLLLGMLALHRYELRPVYKAVPRCDLTVVRLTAPLKVIEERLRRRGHSAEDEISAARWWVPRSDASDIADHIVDNSSRPPDAVAEEVLRRAGWLAGSRPAL